MQTLNRRIAAFEYAKGYSVESVYAVSDERCRDVGEVAKRTLLLM